MSEPTDDHKKRFEQIKAGLRDGSMKIELGNEAAKKGGRAVAVSAFPPNPYWPNGGIQFQWARPGIGFGEISLFVIGDQLVCMTEGMDDDFLLDVLRQAIEEARQTDG